jgi:glycosyltransferase involved in cell wall biosynthesis
MQTKISAIIHVRKSTLDVLGRALDSLRVCDDLIVVDHGGADESIRIAREHGARVLRAAADEDAAACAGHATYDWVLCLCPEESLTESLEASLFEWRLATHTDEEAAFNIALREQQGTGWRLLPAETRLVNRHKVRWSGEMPAADASAPLLQGHILRIPDI